MATKKSVTNEVWKYILRLFELVQFIMLTGNISTKAGLFSTGTSHSVSAAAVMLHYHKQLCNATMKTSAVIMTFAGINFHSKFLRPTQTRQATQKIFPPTYPDVYQEVDTDLNHTPTFCTARKGKERKRKHFFHTSIDGEIKTKSTVKFTRKAWGANNFIASLTSESTLWDLKITILLTKQSPWFYMRFWVLINAQMNLFYCTSHYGMKKV